MYKIKMRNSYQAWALSSTVYEYVRDFIELRNLYELYDLYNWNNVLRRAVGAAGQISRYTLFKKQ